MAKFKKPICIHGKEVGTGCEECRKLQPSPEVKARRLRSLGYLGEAIKRAKE